MIYLFEAGRRHEASPVLPIVETAIPVARPTFAVLTTGIGAEKHPARLQRDSKVAENARDFAPRYVE